MTDLVITCALLAAALGIFAFGSWRMSHPADPLKPRMVPWRTVLVVVGVAGFLIAVHLVNLLGINTGAPAPR